MTTLSGFVAVVLRGQGLAGLALAVGGVAYALFVLRPFDPPSPLRQRALGRCLRLVAAGAVLLLGAQALTLGLQPLVLADERGVFDARAFFSTAFARAALARIGLGVCLALAAVALARKPAARAGWGVLAALALLLGGNSAWLSHAMGRLEDRGLLMALEVFHQLAAAVWVGGLMHVTAFSLLSREAPEEAETVGCLRRFSALVLGSVGALVAAGILLGFYYVDGLEGLAGTGYGIMILTKVVVLAGALVLGVLNFLAVRSVSRRGGIVPFRLWRFVEAEVGLGLTLLLAAAALTSLPPARDVVEDRAALAEVAGRFVPQPPSFASPAIAELLRTAAPITDAIAARKREEYQWSEYNHHVAGLFVLVMGLLALLERTRLGRWARHWPLLFLGLAAFLFVRNDPRAWPLGPAGFWETMLLPDVLQHRLAVALIVAFAAFEWAVRTGRLLAAGWSYVFPILTAAGGALLLTHSHALFNLKAEFLLEVTHVPLGVLGVFVGWSRWLELRLPAPENRIPGRVWAVGFVLIGALLLFYREA
jgi:putative copper resistance protein D